ncbi:MAG: glycosyl hydrolase family protein [Lachnospiraceae bacterium]|nr:glycosyl hydrolase family protein [Lachnospiraceae bacterium]
MKKSTKIILAVMLVVLLAVVALVVVFLNNKPAKTTEATDTATEANSEDTTEATTEEVTEEVVMGNDLSYEGYNLVWEDNFDAPELNRDDWNVELHEPGWVNEEWQEYVDSEENIFIENGKLVLRPVKTTDAEGNDYYTSGRVNTQNKKDFTYGIFEAKLKVPEGVGYLPAFWLMSTDENVYGQWPRCGEVDIMEVHGSETTTNYGTIHYGNPHNQSQGTYTLEGDTFSDSYHVFTVEWEPGKISWYLDGNLYHTESDWYSITEGQGELTYPAPFDQPFYIILNLAVGGSWVGYPDETTDFENARYEIDYVKVYQKDSYDENVTKPEKEVTFREPAEDGELLFNRDFSEAEDLTDEEVWKFLLAEGGAAEASIADNEMTITVDKSGSLEYSVQLVQPNLPIRKGGTYEITFDAYAVEEDRTMIVAVTAPEVSWIRYFPDTTLDLTTEKQSYKYQFEMTEESDPHGRLEFNMGAVTSTSDIKISNVSLKEISYVEPVVDNSKVVLADGNFIYNGKFQEGEKRLGFWEIDNQANAALSSTDWYDGRKLKIEGSGISADTPLVFAQSDLALITGNFVFTAYIEGEAGKTVNVTVGGESFDIVLEEGKTVYTSKVALASATDKNFSIKFAEPGDYLIDNVSLVEDSLIKNGSFNAGLSGFEPYAYTPDNVTWVVDSLTEDNAVDFTINKTGGMAWHIQLKQNGVELEQGQWYRLTMDAKCSMDRQIMFALQKDGSRNDDDWTPYSGEKIIDLTSEYQTYTIEFLMEDETDLNAVLSVSMGAVNGPIKEQHRVCIDNILLEKIDEPENAEELLAEQNKAEE